MRRMKPAGRKRRFWLLLAAAIGAWLSLTPAHAQTAAATGKTLTRTIDPVTVQGREIGTLNGTPIDRLGMFAVDGGKWTPIPFQVDERLAGEYVFRSGSGASADTDRGLLDADDEVAFISSDAGPAVDSASWPAGAQKGVEITLYDPADGGRAAVYLFAFSGPAPRSPKDYVVYHVDRNEIETTDYLIGYHPQAPISINKLIVKPAAGGSGQSVADRQKIRMEAISIWNLVHFTRNENDFQASVIAYNDGPVRILRKTRNRVILFWRIPSPSVELTSVYWKTGMEFPISLNLPFRISGLFREAKLKIYTDSPPNVPNRRFYNQHNPAGVLIDGRMQENEIHFDRRPSDWQVVAGTTVQHREGWFSRQIFLQEHDGVTLPAFYRDDVSVPDPPEQFPGCFGCLGFEIQGVERLDAGTYSLKVQMYPMPAYRPGDEHRYLNLVDQPLRKIVRALSSR